MRTAFISVAELESIRSSMRALLDAAEQIQKEQPSRKLLSPASKTEIERQIGALDDAVTRSSMALTASVSAMEEMGFDDPDQPISGADTVDMVCEVYPKLKAALEGVQ